MATFSDVLISATGFRRARQDPLSGTSLIDDEATFTMDGCVNTWNVRSYAPRNQPPTHFEYYRNCSKEKLTVWAGLIGSGEILGPYFFEGNVTGNTYLVNIRGRSEERNNGRLARG